MKKTEKKIVQKTPEKQLLADLKSLAKEVRMIKELAPMSIVNHPFRLMWLSFLKGIMLGFGTFLGATLLVAILIKLLSEISVVPFIGEFIQSIIDQLNTPQ